MHNEIDIYLDYLKYIYLVYKMYMYVCVHIHIINIHVV